jgi:hypothetical protein
VYAGLQLLGSPPEVWNELANGEVVHPPIHQSGEKRQVIRATAGGETVSKRRLYSLLSKMVEMRSRETSR